MVKNTKIEGLPEVLVRQLAKSKSAEQQQSDMMDLPSRLSDLNGSLLPFQEEAYR